MTPLVTQTSWTNHLLIMSGSKTAAERHFYMMLFARERFPFCLPHLPYRPESVFGIAAKRSFACADFSFTYSKFVVSGGVASMKCPFCKNEMVVGSISQDRYALKWISAEKDMGLLNFTPLVKGIKLTSLADGTAVKVFYCEPCRKFIIDQDDLRL